MKNEKREHSSVSSVFLRLTKVVHFFILPHSNMKAPLLKFIANVTFLLLAQVL